MLAYDQHLIDQISDTYCHNLARIDRLGLNRRLIFTVPDVGSPSYQTVVAKLIIPADFMVTLAYMAIGRPQPPEQRLSSALLCLDTDIAN
jgi:hypothetical protein